MIVRGVSRFNLPDLVGDLQLVAAGQRGGPRDVRDAVLLEQLLDAPGELLGDGPGCA